MCADIKSTFVIKGGQYSFSHSPDFVVRDDKIFVNRDGKYVYLSGPVFIEKSIEDVESGEISVTIAGYNSIADKKFAFDVKREALVAGPNNVVLRHLFNNGLEINPSMANVVLKFLISNKAAVVKGFRKIGWANIDNRHVFVLPNKVFGVSDQGLYKFSPPVVSPIYNAISERGTLEEWQRNVFSATKGNPLMLFVLGVAFLGPLLGLLGLEGGMFHFYGVSSIGKTTCLQLCVSVYGNAEDPAQGSGSMSQTWNTSSNAIEGTAMACNDLVLGMDELGMHASSSVGQLAYGIANGMGKQTMTRDRGMREMNAWRVQVVSTGEYSYAAMILDTTKKQPRTGQMIRVTDIPVDGGLFPACDEAKRGEMVTSLKKAAVNYFGTAKIPYLEHLVAIANNKERVQGLQGRLNDYLVSLLASVSKSLDSAQVRAARRFAALGLALELARDAGCIDSSDEEIKHSIEHALALWLADTETVSEAENGLAQLIHTIQSNPSRFANVLEMDRKGNRLLGYRDDIEQCYVIPKESLVELTGRANCKPVISLLISKGMLIMNNSDNGKPRPTKRVRLANGERVTAYVISFKLFRAANASEEVKFDYDMLSDEEIEAIFCGKEPVNKTV